MGHWMDEQCGNCTYNDGFGVCRYGPPIPEVVFERDGKRSDLHHFPLVKPDHPACSRWALKDR